MSGTRLQQPIDLYRRLPPTTRAASVRLPSGCTGGIASQSEVRRETGSSRRSSYRRFPPFPAHWPPEVHVRFPKGCSTIRMSGMGAELPPSAGRGRPYVCYPPILLKKSERRLSRYEKKGGRPPQAHFCCARRALGEARLRHTGPALSGADFFNRTRPKQPLRGGTKHLSRGGWACSPNHASISSGMCSSAGGGKALTVELRIVPMRLPAGFRPATATRRCPPTPKGKSRKG